MNNIKQHIKVIIAGGGTGGHIFPAVAIANCIKHYSSNADILFVGANGKMEMEKVPKEGYKIIGLDIAGFNRSNMLKNIFLPFKILKSFMQAKSVLKNFKPDVAIGVGGYASFPVLYMAQRQSIPTLIQEQNSHAGKSNKILSKRAKAVCVAYDGMEKYFPNEKITLTGNPVRTLISTATVTKQEAIQFFGLNENKKTVLVIGGSLGAKAINETLMAKHNVFVDKGLQIIWQTGKLSFENAKQSVSGKENDVKVYDFVYEMDKAYAAADIIISRAGALSIAELCIVGKPVVFVPFPFAAEDHQTTNALALVNKNAAVMVKDVDAKNELIEKTISLLENETMMNMFSENIKALAITDADTRIVNKIFEIVE